MWMARKIWQCVVCMGDEIVGGREILDRGRRLQGSAPDSAVEDIGIPGFDEAPRETICVLVVTLKSSWGFDASWSPEFERMNPKRIGPKRSSRLHLG